MLQPALSIVQLLRDLGSQLSCQRLQAPAAADSQLCLQEPEDLFETVSQCLLSGVDRDALSGWGAIVHIM